MRLLLFYLVINICYGFGPLQSNLQSGQQALTDLMEYMDRAKQVLIQAQTICRQQSATDSPAIVAGSMAYMLRSLDNIEQTYARLHPNMMPGNQITLPGDINVPVPCVSLKPMIINSEGVKYNDRKSSFFNVNKTDMICTGGLTTSELGDTCSCLNLEPNLDLAPCTTFFSEQSNYVSQIYNYRIPDKCNKLAPGPPNITFTELTKRNIILGMSSVTCRDNYPAMASCTDTSPIHIYLQKMVEYYDSIQNLYASQRELLKSIIR